MPKKLTSRVSSDDRSLLSDHRSMPFILCFSQQLENGFEFKDLKQSDIKEFHNFYVKVVGNPYSDADRLLREPDKNDLTSDGIQIQHYMVSQTFRIHGYLQNGMFHVIRLDPRHKVHDKK